MRKLTVSGENGYDILIGSGILKDLGVYVKNISTAKKVLVISDSNVLPIYGKSAAESLKQNGFEVFAHFFAAGEESKNLDTVKGMLEELSNAGLTRGDIVVALGGGVTGDMAGFASAIYLRGIDFVQVPTTLLSQVDSSVGGKTGCDTEFGKNLVGAFHNPKLVLIDTDTLKTLPERYLRDGMGEVIKYGLIKSESLFNSLENGINEDVIFECVNIKREIVENDFTEKGERMLLNFGHTLAHAIEKYYNYKGLAHGEAVSIGMHEITKQSEAMGKTEKGTAEKVKAMLIKHGLPYELPVSVNELFDAMLHDKKRRADFINLVLIEKIGESFVFPIKTNEIENFFAE